MEMAISIAIMEPSMEATNGAASISMPLSSVGQAITT